MKYITTRLIEETQAPSQIYGVYGRKHVVNALKGNWKVIDFRPPLEGDTWLSANLNIETDLHNFYPKDVWNARLILSRIEQPDPLEGVWE